LSCCGEVDNNCRSFSYFCTVDNTDLISCINVVRPSKRQ
jgi:hypothetical protein